MSSKFKQYVVGLTGGIGSGKTTVSDIFARFGIDIIDADLIAHESVKPGQEGLNALVKEFGDRILDSQGCLNRAQMRQEVFSDNQAKERLESILHPIIRATIFSSIKNSSSKYCVLSAPLLFENGLHKYTDTNLSLDTNENKQIERTLKRDGGEEQTIRAIIKSQIDRQQRLKLSDDIVTNNDDIDSLYKQIEALHKKYLQNANLKVKLE